MERRRDEKLVNDIECFIKSMELVSRNNGNFIHTPEEKKTNGRRVGKIP